MAAKSKSTISPTCGNCAAFVLRYQPKDEEARRRMEGAGVDFISGRCHLNPLTLEKRTDDHCLQFRASDKAIALSSERRKA